jgi:L-alanine-DL-glutamate epimerase-like enolase superfamily enzyme
MRPTAPISTVDISAFTIPTLTPEADGTLEWESTTIVIVEAFAGGKSGLGYTYADSSVGVLIRDILLKQIQGKDAFDVSGLWHAMVRSIRNQGRPGISSMAIAAVDNALWDLKAKLLELPLVQLLGSRRQRIPVYGSGGFTNYSDRQLADQISGWANQGIRCMKMKVGTDPVRDPDRVRVAREFAGDDVALFVDANGAYTRKQALRMAESFATHGVTWFEEPVSSDDLEGLRLVRDCAPRGMDVAAGEYGYDAYYFRRMIEAGAVDVLQADATRCAGITGFLQADALSVAHNLPLSSHCAPTQHLHAMCAAERAVHLEYFYDHARIEPMLFDGAIVPVNGELQPDLSRPGVGIELKRQDALRYAA